MDYQNFINGQWVDARNGQRLETLEPATGEPLGTVPLSQPDDVDDAVRAAKEAFRSWRLVPAPERGEKLFRVAEILTRRKEELSQFLSREMGKVLAEARGDVQEAIDMAYYMGGEGRRLFGKVAPSEMRRQDRLAQRDPIGVVGMITPWNFPSRHPCLEDVSRARLRQHRRLQASRGHPRPGGDVRGGAGRGGHPGGRGQHGHRRRADHRQRHRGAS